MKRFKAFLAGFIDGLGFGLIWRNIKSSRCSNCTHNCHQGRNCHIDKKD